MIVDLNRNCAKSVLLCSMGRAGSTWTASIINYRNDYRYMFEPLHPAKVPDAAPFDYPLYLRPEDEDPLFLDPMANILSGRIRDRWIDGRNRRSIASKRLIKMIRANLLMKWLDTRFPSVPMILLFRHPCPVVLSWIRAGFGDGIRPRDRVLACEALLHDFLAPFADAYRQADTVFERLVFLWCISYYVPLKQFNPGRIHLAFYENLTLDAPDEIGRLFRFLGRNDVGACVSYVNRTRREEGQVHKGREIRDSVAGWKERVSPEQMAATERILSMFGFGDLYNENVLPDPSVAVGLMSGA